MDSIASMDAIEYPQVVTIGCGLDVHKDSVVLATVRRSTRKFKI